MPQLILSPQLSSDSLYLERAAEKLGWPVHRARRYRLPDRVEDPVVYGDVAFCDVMARELGLGLLEPSNTWLAELPEKYLGRRVQAMKHRDLVTVTGRHFIKPANDKVFTAGIYERGSHVPRRYIDPETPVYVSEVVSFYAEMRCYVLDHEFLTGALYLGMLEPSEEVELWNAGREWATALLRDPEIQTPSAFVLDVGLTSPDDEEQPGEWVAIEANQGYCSGVYSGGYVAMSPSTGTDPALALQVVARSGGLRSKVSADDERWLRPLE